jgi:unspecific monooxygenase
MAVFEAYDPDFIDDPYPTYARLRQEAPVFFDPTWDLTFFARHGDVSGILKDRRFGRDVRSAVPQVEIDQEVYGRVYPPHLPNWTKYIRGSFIDLEPPRHTRIRRLVQSAFGKRASETYRPRMQETADRMIDQALQRGSMEAIAEFATPVPLAMIAELLGIPTADQPQLVTWSHAIVRVFDQGCSPEEAVTAERAVTEFVAYMCELIEGARRRPREDLVSSLVEAEFEGDHLSEDELVATAILTLNAGHEATVQAIGNGLIALAAHPDQFARLRETPGLIGAAVEELLRYDSPLQMFERWVLEDLVWGDTALRRGTKVGLLFGSANHDEVVFDTPRRLDLARHPNQHVSFGAGIHLCVGAPLARVELDVAFSTFARRVSEFAVDADMLWRTPSLVFRGVRALPLRLTA